MASSSTGGGAGSGAIPATSSSTLSAHAAPFTFPGSQKDGDASRSIDDKCLLNGENKDSYSLLPAAYFGMRSCDTVYPASTLGIQQSQPSSPHGIRVNVYPSSNSSTSGIVAGTSAKMASDFKQHQIPLTSGKASNGSKYPTVTIRSPPNKTTENNVSFSSISKMSIRQNDESNKETGNDISFRKSSAFNNPANVDGTSQGTMVFSKKLNPDFSVKPLHITSTCASSCVTMADDVNPDDPSECSVDSPCWRGTASHISSFDVLQTSAAQSVTQETVAFDAVQEQSSSTEAPTELQNGVNSKSKQNHSQSHVELGLSKKPGDNGTNLTKDSHWKELAFAKHGAAKYNTEQKYCLEVKDDCVKRSGLNSAAPDFIPSSVRKSNTCDGSCSSSVRSISGILKAFESMLDVLWNNYSDEIELEEHELSLLQSVIENLQSYCYLHKARKVPVKGASDKAGGLKAHHSQNAVPKSLTGNYKDSCTADNGKGIIVANLSDSSRLLGDLRKNSMTGFQYSLHNYPKELSCEDEHSQVLIYKTLWIEAERANCALKYQLKQTRVEIESSIAHIGGGRRNPSFQLCDLGRDPSNSYGSVMAYPPVLKDHPLGGRSRELFWSGDYIQSGDNDVPSRLKEYITMPKNIQEERVLPGLEHTSVHHHVHPGLQLVPDRAYRRLKASTSDGMSSLSHITGRDGILRDNGEFGSSDWEHVLKEEIG